MASHLVGTHPITTFTTPVPGTSPIDANVVRGNDNTIKVAYSDGHDADATIHFQDSTNAARPAAGTAGRKWLDSDTFRVYFDDGTNWQEIAYAVSGGAGSFTSVTFTTTLISTTALATPSALIATTFEGFASTVSGAVLMGFGTTNDVSLKNRAGTTVLGIGPNTTTVNMVGALTYGGVTLSAAVTGTGNMVLSASPTFTGTLTAATVAAGATSVTTLAGTGAVSGFTTAAFSSGVTLGGATPSAGWFVAANTKGLIVANSGGSNKVGIQLDASNVWQFGDGLASVFNAGISATTGTFSAAVKSSSASGGVGYATGAGGTVTQATNKATGVTLNTICGAITMNGAATVQNETNAFVVTNSAVAAGDVVILSLGTAGTAVYYNVWVEYIQVGQFSIGWKQLGAVGRSEALVIYFAVIKGVTS